MPRMLGKLPYKPDPRTLQLAHYWGVQPPSAPTTASWHSKLTISSAMGNTSTNDCTCATMGYMIETWTSNEATEVIVPESAALAAYSAITGYDPTTGANDKGAYILPVLNYWRKTGVDGHTILAYATVPRHQFHMEAACYLFGGVYLGVQLPLSADAQVGGVWDVPPQGPLGDGAPGSWGGHCVPLVGYGKAGLTCITWGQLQHMTWNFLFQYVDEAYAILSKDFFNAAAISASGFNMAQLTADLALVTR